MIKIISVGKIKEKYLVDLIEDYKTRITKYQKVNAQIIECSRSEHGFKNTIQTNENKELIIISEIDYNLYYEFEGDLPYDKLVEFMGQAAYDHGMIDELIIEM